MKVTVNFADTAVVVPCKDEWTVRDLIEQATRRYRRILEQQHGESDVRTHHLEYTEGGILDKDDLLSDLVEDRDRLVAMFEVQNGRTDSPREYMSNGYSTASPSPESMVYLPHLDYKEPIRGEIEVNEAALKGNTPLLVRSSSDSALAPSLVALATPPPINQSHGSPEPEINHVLRGALDRLRTDSPPTKMSQVHFSTLTRTVEFPADWGPLGIHVIPYCSSLSGRTLGLHIKGIEGNSRARKENLFHEEECIVQINDIPLQDKTFAQSQDVFRQAMSDSSVHLEVLPLVNKARYEKTLIGQLFTGDGKTVRANAIPQQESKQDAKPSTKLDAGRSGARSRTPDPTAVSALQVEPQYGSGSSERASPASPARETSDSPTPGGLSQSPPASRSSALPSLANLTNRKGGKRIKIDLKKGSEGLGFTVVTREPSVNAPGPILVKNILPRGAAVKDGRLQPGDRILEVNGVDMTNRSQEELVAMLRSTKQGESVSVVVARQEDIFFPRELKGEEASSLILEDGREQLMYEIPLNETGSAGLGVSLKGNKSRETGEDLGIFIKSIIHGGAAYKDGRLSVNDQLIAVNGESLLGRSNHAAMETLRHSMSSEGNSRGTIQLVVLRISRQIQQMGSAIPPSNPAPSGLSASQPSTQTGASNQVLPGEVSQHQQQPPPPRRSSSLLHLLRRRASEPPPHNLRQCYTQRPGETHTRHTYGFDQREGLSGYVFGFTQEEVEYSEDDTQVDPYTQPLGYEFVPPSGSLSSFRRPLERNLNREHHYDYGYTHRRTHSPTIALDNSHRPLFCDAQGNELSYTSRHTRSHTLDAIHTQGSTYTEYIRVKARQMYGDPPTHSRSTHRSANRYLDQDSHNYAHNRDLTRHQQHHLRFSGGL